MTELELRLIPITEAPVVVPVPILDVRFLIVLEVNNVGALPVNIPTTWEAAPVAVN